MESPRERVFILDLQQFQTSGSKVFTGRPRGISVRNESKIDSIEVRYEKIKVNIPINISSINPSFLEELFKNVVLKLGKEQFLKKFEFVNEGRYKIQIDLDEAIDRILKDENAL